MSAHNYSAPAVELMGSMDQEFSEAGIRELLKSLEANEGVTDLAQLRGGAALQPQSLEASVVSLLFDESYFKAMNRIAKAPEYSTLIEYNQRTDFGTYNRGGFMQQAENPRQADPSFRRKTEDIKFLRELWSISAVLAASRTVTQPEVEAVDAATMRLLEKCEDGFFFSDSRVIPESWRGLRQTIEEYAVSSNSTDLIVDLRGASITETILKDACKKVSDRLGLVNDMYMGYNLQNDIEKLLTPATNGQRFSQNMGSLTFDLGHIIPGFKTTFALNGRVTFIPDFFIQPENEGVPTVRNQSGAMIEGSTSDLAPAIPSFAAVASAVGGGLFTGMAGDIVRYRIAAENRHGLSKAAAIVATGALTAADDKVTLTITDNSVNNFADGYRIYRETEAGSGIYRIMKRIPATPGGPTVYEDKNADIPGTTIAFIGDFNSRGAEGAMRTIRIKELAPFHKTRYSIIGPFFWGACNYYAAPVNYAPQKFVMIKNIKVGS